MRRFVATSPGKALCHTVVVALLIPFLTMASIGRAEAQLQTLPSWAVVDFVNHSGKGGDAIGRMAAESVANELSKTNKYDVLPREQISRAIETLQLTTPVTEQTSLLRLAQELRASEIITGEVLNWRIRVVEGGKQADVILRAVVRNVASGLPVNGGASFASSSVRPSDVADEVMLAEAFSFASTRVVADIVTRTLPRATILNTFESSAIINQGSRSGIKGGQDVIVLRGHEQVATASVVEVGYDDAVIRIKRSDKGLRPGDKVQVVFEPPLIASTWEKDNTVAVLKRPGRRSNTAFLQMLFAAGLLAFFFSGGKSKKNDIIDSARAEAFFDNSPKIRLSFDLDEFFSGGNEDVLEMHVWRDTPSDPIPGDSDAGIDRVFYGNEVQDGVLIDTASGDPGPQLAQLAYGTCVTGLSGISFTDGFPGLFPGEPARYTLRLLHTVTQGNGQADCFSMSSKINTGIATALDQPVPQSPDDGFTLEGSVADFTVNALANTQFVSFSSAFYGLQISESPSFPTGSSTITIRIGQNGSIMTGTSNEKAFPVTQDVTFAGVDLDTINGGRFADNSSLYWRIGARNVQDNPGPVPQAGARYIFSELRTLSKTPL